MCRIGRGITPAQCQFEIVGSGRHLRRTGKRRRISQGKRIAYAAGKRTAFGFDNFSCFADLIIAKPPVRTRVDLAAAIEAVELTSDLAANLDQLFALSPVIDAFFDHTMVMAEDEAVRNNRLALLASLTAKAGQLAQFNQINTK